MRERILYLECAAGISGDMTVGALLDLGADRETLMRAMNSVPADGFSVQIGRVFKSGLDCCDFSVLTDAAHENHDHDMAYLYGHEHDHGHDREHDHDHEHEHHHHHDHDHDHDHHHDHDHDHDHHHHHEHRGMAEIREILAQVDMTPEAHALTLKIFGILARAEARAHGTTPEQVHFHEVGAVDSIADIVAAAVCFDDLRRREGITRVAVPSLAEGQGTVRCAHGILPVPVPAVTHIAAEAGLTLRIMEARGEFVTPTGAAIAAALITDRGLPEAFRIVRTGLGAGKRTYERPSVVRAMLLEAESAQPSDGSDEVMLLETNIDDASGEILGYVMGRLLEAGARDVWYTPIHMKKDRPAWMLSVLCTEQNRMPLEHLIFSETTTIGIRRVRMDRTVLPRRTDEVPTRWGSVKVKVCTLPDGTERKYPEYDSVRATAAAAGVPAADVYREAERC